MNNIAGTIRVVFNRGVVKLKPKQLLRPITRNEDSSVNQSEFEAITRNQRQARENARVQQANVNYFRNSIENCSKRVTVDQNHWLFAGAHQSHPTGRQSKYGDDRMLLQWQTKAFLNFFLFTVHPIQIVFNGTKSYFQDFKDSRVIETSGPVFTYKVDDLFPGTNYTFAVRARTPCGIGDLGNAVAVETIAGL